MHTQAHERELLATPTSSVTFARGVLQRRRERWRKEEEGNGG
jgi:hypothetical protein